MRRGSDLCVLSLTGKSESLRGESWRETEGPWCQGLFLLPETSLVYFLPEFQVPPHCLPGLLYIGYYSSLGTGSLVPASLGVSQSKQGLPRFPESPLDEVGLGMHAQVLPLLACSRGHSIQGIPWGRDCISDCGMQRPGVNLLGAADETAFKELHK